MRVELHCHSLHSDGIDGPAEVAHKAAASGVVLFCLTDHDTTAGDAAAAEALRALPVRVLRGMELSCMHAGRVVHLLLHGLAGDAAEAPLAGAIATLRARRAVRVHEICARLAALGVVLDADAILRDAGAATAGRPHVARALVAAGASRTVNEAFASFLHDGGPADVPLPAIDVAAGVALGVAAGARVSLAHPHTLGPDIAKALCVRHRGDGLEGLEAFYGPYPVRVRRAWAAFADDLGLVTTAGSDYHGVGALPGVDRPGVELDDRRAERLLSWLGL